MPKRKWVLNEKLETPKKRSLHHLKKKEVKLNESCL
jgi:hypothetical protein